MNIDMSALIAVVGCALSIGTFFVGRMTAAKTSGRETGQVLTELGYIKKGIDGLERDIKEIKRQYTDLDVRVSKLEEAIRIYHKEA
jgi:peptidoglycan hydrolase CwlO-like protein